MSSSASHRTGLVATVIAAAVIGGGLGTGLVINHAAADAGSGQSTTGSTSTSNSGTSNTTTSGVSAGTGQAPAGQTGGS